MSVADAIRAATAKLTLTSDTARLDAELLMAHALGLTRSDMLIRAMQGEIPSAFNGLIERRATREPVAHIIGEAEFYGRSFRISQDVLIPRGDSETLIEAAREYAGNARRVLDLGTGSGALLITAMLELGIGNGVGVDASGAALAMAKGNASALGLDDDRAEFHLRDWREAGWAKGLGRFDLILCNPPYVEIDAELEPDVRDFEPADALFSGPEGLDDYRILLPQLGNLMSKNAVAVFEIGAAQQQSVSDIASACGFTVEARNDLAARPRALIIR
ncbi:peptide chain release factor N(5)-glutamine methyltransferase [Erythrobacter insulae]|uniref:Peptide chain release factor N(5)-glutamine methyltransferase n=1 Tax=Erythrobacter insulae TaxID=2584124 RepID=A0A547PBN6_9SPHN|nr:peptide chain release factor N(5)-glutamine methyltransferase [Erythrobacter insulae]TRD11550.1 peptide chain release factor N(5)-glutamine methyltransferase [Erythrobacter insulae]